jgi:hypothetical protein
MAVPSILVAVIATGELAKARWWKVYPGEQKEEEAVIQVGWARVDRRRIRPRDFTVYLAATPDEAELLWKGLKGFRACGGRGTMIPFAADKEN